ncbi:serine hydrolase domain-containing protein [Thermus filiformis]|uniref:serine hydrolase domain-containing protein n=1 Tax=Thermus filiformis TaxID=276 RepID=UPI00069F52F1|nr:serine hydrolase domain-containing protein [Thermus filiformis]
MAEVRIGRRAFVLGGLGWLVGCNVARNQTGGESFLEAVRRRFRVPALAAGCLLNDSLVFAEAVGTVNANSTEPVSIDDPFHLGSCTKAMAATISAMLVERGKLSWDTTVAEAFPDLADRIHPGFRPVTLLQLLSHRGGLDDRKPDNKIFPRLRGLQGPITEQRRTLVELALSREPAYPPGEQMAYSNFGYAIAGAMAESATGKPWEELAQELLFQPLGMTTAGFGAPERVWGHRGGWLKPCRPVPPGPGADNPPVLSPAGRVHSAMKDWLKFASLHLRGSRGDTEVLSRSSFEFLHRDHYRQGYALGWGVVERRWAGGVALTHAGSNTLWYSVIWLAPNRNAAFVAATNCGTDKAFRACDAAIGEMIQRFLL